MAKGGAVASPGRGGVGPVPPAEADSHGGLTQRALPHRLSYICFQEEENQSENTLTFFFFWRQFCSSCFLVALA